MTDRQTEKEIRAFKSFAKICSLPINTESIKKMEPPKPDIQCEVNGKGLLAFELVEIIDSGFANNSNKQFETKKELRRVYNSFPKNKKQLFDKLYHDASICVDFQNECTMTQRKNIIKKIFEHLLTLDNKFEGETLPNTTLHREKLNYIDISRGTLNGPDFDVGASGAIGDPTVSAISSKFDKKYETECSLHLLGYIERNLLSPYEIWHAMVMDFVKEHIHKSIFEKVWIFDFSRNEILFDYPR